MNYGWPSDQALMRGAWKAFSDHVMHRSRFLFELLQTQNTWGRTDELGTDDFLMYLGDAIAKQPVREFGLDSDFFRARAVREDHDPPDSANSYTSPPSHVAAQGRMNPAGIAYFYGALELRTAAIEVYSPDSYAAIATFTPVRALRLVDLTGVSVPSPFDPEVELTEHEHRLFLIGFVRDISRSIIRDERIHQEYVPTQAVTEYIRYRSEPPVDGIVFNSARVDGTNVVIFADQEQCLGRGKDPMLVPGDSIRRVEYVAPATTEGKPGTLKPTPRREMLPARRQDAGDELGDDQPIDYEHLSILSARF